MKNYFMKKFLMYCFTVILFGVTFISCDDKCKNIICENGFCIEGDCFCSDGYSGTNCEIKESDKFIGSYEGTQTCFGKVQPLKIKISNFPDNPWDVSMELDNSSGVEFLLRANVNRDSLFLDNQFVEMIDTFGNDPILNLIYPSKGILIDDKYLNIDLIQKGDMKATCRIEVEKG